MAKGKTFMAAAAAVASLSALATTSQAVVYTEGPSDAGQTLATAAVAGNVTGVSGTIGANQDADLYKITLPASTYTFSDAAAGAAVDSTSPGTLDTALFLLSSTGTALYTNDDASGTNVASSFTVSLAAGTYYLGVSLSGNEPVNSNNQLLFVQETASNTTGTRVGASGVNPTTENTFNGQSYSSDLGTYNVSITSAVPEPSTWIVAGASVVALAFVRRRRAA